MKKTSIVTLITALALSISPVFAQTLIKATSASDDTVDEIIAEIEQVRMASKKVKVVEITEDRQTDDTVKVDAIISEIEEAKMASKKINVVEVTETDLAVKKVIQEKVVTTQANQTKDTKNRFTITIPSVPEVPQAIKISSELPLVDKEGHIILKNLKTLYPPREEIVFSTNVAPARFNKNKKKDETAALLGNVDNARVTAYLQSPLLTVDEVVAKLKQENFEILSVYKVDKKGTATSIVFTNDAIKKAASINMRGFAGTLRIVVDTENKLVNISNPIYMLKAFMQKEYNPNVAENVLTQIHTMFSDLKASTEIVKFLALERFQFMENMPFYQDMQVIAKAKNEELLKRAQKSKKIVYEQHLENGSIILGVELGSRTSKFVEKIGYQNSGLLPYPVLIENGEAKILAPQYYIAVMYPQLKMSKFMTIATVPGAINKDIDKIFR